MGDGVAETLIDKLGISRYVTFRNQIETSELVASFIICAVYCVANYAGNRNHKRSVPFTLISSCLALICLYAGEFINMQIWLE